MLLLENKDTVNRASRSQMTSTPEMRIPHTAHRSRRALGTIRAPLSLLLAAALVLALAIFLLNPSVSWAKERSKKKAKSAQATEQYADDNKAGKKKRKKKRRAQEGVLPDSSAANSSAKQLGKNVPSVNKKISAVADADLAQVYKYIALGKSSAALNQIEALLSKAPNHKLLHLLRADVLTIMSQGTRAAAQHSTAATLAKLNPAQHLQLAILQQEAWLRLNSQANHAKATDPQLVPRQLVKLADNEPYALVVDSKLSRLYVYQNTPNGAPKLVNDYYVTQGALGVLKSKEGDSRTPIGAYFIDRVIDQKLPDFYGSGALNIDYPNAWDKRLGRTGYGIWLHGTPSETYARAPYASNGCVVLANPDIEAIFKLPRSGAMPIVLVDKLDWVQASSLEAPRKQLTELITQWINSVASGALLTNLVAIEYPSEPGMVLTRFDVVDTKQRLLGKKELYWKKESGQWKIVLDTTL